VGWCLLGRGLFWGGFRWDEGVKGVINLIVHACGRI
jgi:hypothetical protein